MISRRRMVRQVGMAGMAAFIPVTGIRAAPQSSLDAKQRRTVEAIVARLIPTDENGPGAAEAQVARYIERALSGALRSEKGTYAAGLAGVDARAQAAHGAAFAELSAEKQDAVLAAMEQSPFFQMIRAHALEGMFADPYYGGNAQFAGWDLIGYPGPRLGVTEEEQKLGAKLRPARQSAYRGSHGGH